MVEWWFGGEVVWWFGGFRKNQNEEIRMKSLEVRNIT